MLLVTSYALFPVSIFIVGEWTGLAIAALVFISFSRPWEDLVLLRF